MKKLHTYLSMLLVAVMTNMILASCEDDKNAELSELSIKVFSPTKVLPGQTMTINGNNLDAVTSVTFAGNIEVKNFEKLGDGQISLVVPAGVQPGTITVSSPTATAVSRIALEIAKPTITAASPTDQEIKIKGEIIVIGTDMEYIASAIFPGADGNDIVVKACDFKRKSTNFLYLIVPAGIAAGEAQIKLVDFSGAQHIVPTLTLSDEVAEGGGSKANVIWEGSRNISWDWWYMSLSELNYENGAPEIGQTCRFVFANNENGGRFCLCDGWWGGIDLGGSPDANNVWIDGGVNEKEFVISESVFNFMTGVYGGDCILIIGGENLTLIRIEIFD